MLLKYTLPNVISVQAGERVGVSVTLNRRGPQMASFHEHRLSPTTALFMACLFQDLY